MAPPPAGRNYGQVGPGERPPGAVARPAGRPGEGRPPTGHGRPRNFRRELPTGYGESLTLG
ncbi:hypothetical protein GCM10010298_23390 [Streptomyces microflavus]|uniref:Uncharacterized protein n=1 Tax=Streptomyces microflavus TaxID=1919 RepID=A0A7J0D2J4_STRMI|nr:hypothetical protein Smic_75390 [Streptomyces microflavus]GGX58241.1 hypothetical protein GCM10010298_23390 [Streptomyces microflavus]